MNKQLYQQNEDIIKDQDEKLDQIINDLEITKYQTHQINEEIKKQNPLIDQNKKEMEQISTKMDRANEKVKNLIRSQSYCCLYMVILAEVIIFFLVSLL